MTSFCSSPQRPSGPRRLVPGPPRASTQAAARRCRATAQDRIEHNSTTMRETHGAIPLLPAALVHHYGQARPCPAALSRARARLSYEAPPRSRPLPPEHAPPSFFPLPVSAGHPTEPRHHRVRASSRQGCPPPSPDHCAHPQSAPRLHRGRAPQRRHGSARRRLAQPCPALCHHRARIIVDDHIPFGPKIHRTQGIPLQFLESLAP